MGAGELQRQDSLWDRFSEQVPVSLSLSPNRQEHDTDDPQQYDASNDEHGASGVAEAEVAGAPAAVATTPDAVPVVKKLVHGGLTPQQTLLRDKIGFVAGVANIAISAWWMAKHPDRFYWWYTLKALLLYGLRWVIYKSQKQHFFMLEMCYYVNAVLLLDLWAYPHSQWLFKATFGLVAGPLTWSIVALRNSLVLHSLDQMTSLFMHASPSLVIYGLKWYPRPELPHVDDTAGNNLRGIVGGAMALYAIWAAAYYLKVFVFSAKKIREQNYATLFSLMTANRKGMVAKVVFSVPRPFQPMVYMLFHALLCAAATCTAVLFWRSFWAHTIFILVMLLGATWNGATFYFDIFAHRYVSKTGLPPKPEKKQA